MIASLLRGFGKEKGQCTNSLVGVAFIQYPFDMYEAVSPIAARSYRLQVDQE